MGGHSGAQEGDHITVGCSQLVPLFPGMSIALPLVKKIVCMFFISPFDWRWDHMPWKLLLSPISPTLKVLFLRQVV